MTSKIIFGASLAFALFAGTMFTATNVFADDISDIRGPLADIWTAIERLTNQVQNLESQVNTFDTYMLGATCAYVHCYYIIARLIRRDTDLHVVVPTSTRISSHKCIYSSGWIIFQKDIKIRV